jgi:uncharacterized protein YkwD
MTQSDDWEPVNYHNLPHWMKRVSKPKQWVHNAYTKIFHGKPYDYKVEYAVIHGKLRISYWRSVSIQNPAPIISSNRSSYRLNRYHIFLILFVLAGACLIAINPFNPSAVAPSSGIPTPLITTQPIVTLSPIKTQIITSASTPIPIPIDPQTQEIEQIIFEMTNTERQNNGIKSLTFDTNLASIARKHSQDMVDNNYFDHINLGGDGPDERAIKSGYSTTKGYRLGLGENIGKMPTGNVIGVGYVSNTPESIAQAQMKRWMESTGHRRNILDDSYDKIGVGVAYDGHYYVTTQDFW